MEQRDDWHLTASIAHQAGRGDPFAAAIRGTRMPMVIADARQPELPIVFANQAFQDLSGYTREEIIGRNCRFLQGPDTDPAARARIRDALSAGEAVSVDILNYRKDGTTFWNALYLSPVRSDDGELQFFFASQFDVTSRIEAERAIAEQKAVVEAEVRARTEELELALEAKTTLLHEVDHRVKNNLTMIGSLLRLQTRAIKDPAMRQTLDTMLERVDALATVHRRLYQSGDIRRFDVGAFAAELASDVLGASGRDDIVLDAEVEPVMIPASQAAAAGLIVNEMLTNAIKHAWPDNGGRMALAVRQDGGGVNITLADDGCGFEVGSPAQSIGLALIDRLSRQVRGATSWQSGPGGTQVTLRFPAKELQ